MQQDPAALEPTLHAAQRGDVAAFNTLVQPYQRQVYNVCYRTLGNAEDAADATQDAFLSAFRGSDDLSRQRAADFAAGCCASRSTRATTSCGGASGDPPRALMRWTMRPTSWSRRSARSDPSAGPEQQALSGEVARQIEQALDRLAAEQRLAVVLCDVQGLSYDEAAQVMSVELGTVKSRLSRARANLRGLLLSSGELQSPPPRLEQRNP